MNVETFADKMMRNTLWRLGRLLQIRTIRNQTSATKSQMQEMEKSGAIIDEVTGGGPTIPFARAKIGTFFQDIPKLGNTFKEDVVVQNYLKRVLPEYVSKRV